jgi:hypothetical protein
MFLVAWKSDCFSFVLSPNFHVLSLLCGIFSIGKKFDLHKNEIYAIVG